LTLPNAGGGVVLTDSADTSTAKTLTTPTLTSSVLNTAVSGSAVLDEDDMSSNSATKVATQQSIKAYVDSTIDTDMDLVFAGDSGGNLQITMDSETFTIAGGTGIDTVGSGNTLTAQLSSETATLTGTQTLASKTLTSPTMNSPVLNTAVSGTAVLDEDTMSSNSATKAATQQSIKAYIDSTVGTIDLDVAADSGTNIDVDLSSEVFTVAGGTQVASSVSGTTVTLTIDSAIATLTGTETLTNKTFTSPTIDTLTLSSGSSLTGLSVNGTGIVFEGATADAHETTLTAADPTQDNTITIPDSSMTLLTTATHTNQATHIVRCIALG
jgi:hypothetical protein